MKSSFKNLFSIFDFRNYFIIFLNETLFFELHSIETINASLDSLIIQQYLFLSLTVQKESVGKWYT